MKAVKEKIDTMVYESNDLNDLKQRIKRKAKEPLISTGLAVESREMDGSWNQLKFSDVLTHERALAKLGNCSKINASMLRALGHHGTSSSHELLLCLVPIRSNPSGPFFW